MYLPYFKSLRHKLQNLPEIDTVCYEKAAFTLAETLITLVILGIVAAITIPALVNRHRESANRTRIRKAMTAYEAALNKMVIENNLKSDGDIDNWVGNNCANTRPYFKSAQDGANDCSFRTSDGTWWNITDIKNPLIAVNNTAITNLETARTLAKDTSDNTTYAMVGRFDAQGILRVDDPQSETGNATNQAYLSKLYNFVNGVKAGENSQEIDYSRPCSDDAKDANGHIVSCTSVMENGNTIIKINDYGVPYYYGYDCNYHENCSVGLDFPKDQFEFTDICQGDRATCESKGYKHSIGWLWQDENNNWISVYLKREDACEFYSDQEWFQSQNSCGYDYIEGYGYDYSGNYSNGYSW